VTSLSSASESDPVTTLVPLSPHPASIIIIIVIITIIIIIIIIIIVYNSTIW